MWRAVLKPRGRPDRLIDFDLTGLVPGLPVALRCKERWLPLDPAIESVAYTTREVQVCTPTYQKAPRLIGHKPQIWRELAARPLDQHQMLGDLESKLETVSTIHSVTEARHRSISPFTIVPFLSGC